MHLHSFNAALHGLLTEQPDVYIPLFESAAKEVAIMVTAVSKEEAARIAQKVNIQIQLKNFPRVTQIRNLAADHVGKVSNKADKSKCEAVEG